MWRLLPWIIASIFCNFCLCWSCCFPKCAQNGQKCFQKLSKYQYVSKMSPKAVQNQKVSIFSKKTLQTLTLFQNVFKTCPNSFPISIQKVTKECSLDSFWLRFVMSIRDVKETFWVKMCPKSVQNKVLVSFWIYLLPYMKFLEETFPEKCIQIVSKIL